jgi:hypothetical protein
MCNSHGTTLRVSPPSPGNNALPSRCAWGFTSRMFAAFADAHISDADYHHSTCKSLISNSIIDDEILYAPRHFLWCCAYSSPSLVRRHSSASVIGRRQNCIPQPPSLPLPRKIFPRIDPQGVVAQYNLQPKCMASRGQ